MQLYWIIKNYHTNFMKIYWLIRTTLKCAPLFYIFIYKLDVVWCELKEKDCIIIVMRGGGKVKDIMWEGCLKKRKSVCNSLMVFLCVCVEKKKNHWMYIPLRNMCMFCEVRFGASNLLAMISWRNWLLILLY